MKLFNAIAATAAVITCCLGNPLPADASLNVDLNKKRVTMTKDGDARVTMNGPRGRFTLNQGDSIKAWQGVMDWAAEKNNGRKLTRVELYQSLGGSQLKGPMGTKDASEMDNESMEAFAGLYHLMKNTRGY